MHFFAIGALLFVLFAALNPGAMRPADEILVDPARIKNLSSQFERLWQRPPTDTELQGLIDAWVREEVLYREGLAMGLERDDPIIRRRVAQKVMFLADSLSPGEPSDDELQAFLDSDPKRYESPAVYTLQQVYFELQGSDAELQQTMVAALALLNDGDENAADIGDSILLPPALENVTTTDIAGVFGPEFAAALESLPVGVWSGPVLSGYGVHLVRIDTRIPGRSAMLDEVRAAVERDFLNKQASDLSEAFYEALKSRYTVRIVTELAVASGDEAS